MAFFCVIQKIIYPKVNRLITITIILCLLACLSILAFSFQGTRGIWQPDEGYYTGTAVTMMEQDTVLIPYLGEGEIFLDKPPMIYWGIITGLNVFGHSEFAARFFHGLCFILTSLAVGGLSYSMFRDKWLAFLSSLIYATMIIPFIAGNFITPDTILALWITLSALCFWNSVKIQGKTRALWQMLLCAAVGFGFLAKGPAVLIPCGAMFVFLFIRKELPRYFFTSWSLLGLFIFVITGLGWYIWVSFKIPGAFSYFIDNQILGRLITEKYNRNPGLAGALIYLPILVFGSMPWSVIWLEKRNLIKSSLFNVQWWKDLTKNPQQLFLICYFFVPLFILCLASSKLGLYALPIFVPLAIASAKLWKQKAPVIESLEMAKLLKSYARPIKLVSCWVILLVFAKLAIAYYPTPNNMKTLWTQINQYLPAEYELCTIDKRCDGLLFYGAKGVEHVTNKSKPYPTFTSIEPISEEIQFFIRGEENCLFIVMGEDKIAKAIDVLKASGIDCRLVHLPYQRAIIFPELSDKTNTVIKRTEL